MIGDRYWATGIMLTPHGPHEDGFKWQLHVDFYDGGWADDDPTEVTEGRLDVRYPVVDVVAAAKVLKADAERLGIEFTDCAGDPPWVYVESNGEDTEADYPPDWRETAAAVAKALGFMSSRTEVSS